MNRFVILAGTLIMMLTATFNAHAQPARRPDSVKVFLDTVIRIMRREALNRDKVNWDSLQNGAYVRSANAANCPALIPAIQYLFEQLHDHHGAIVYRGMHYGARVQGPAYSNELMTQVGAIGGIPKLKTAILENGYGYVLVPSIEIKNQSENTMYAQQIKDSICRLNTVKLKGWIIDLRLNPGGSMYPMIGGIGSLIGDGKVGFFADYNNKIQHSWSIKNGEVYYDTTQLTYTVNKCPSKNKHIKIAVLIGPLTPECRRGNSHIFKRKA